VALVGIWLALGWLLGGVTATLAVRMVAREPDPTTADALHPAEPCRDASHGPIGFARAAIGWRPIERCPACGALLREHWPFPEIGVAIAFAALAARFGWGLPLALYSALVAALALVVLIDVRHRVIPNAITLSLLVVALAVSPLTFGIGRAILGAAVAGGTFLLLYVLARLLYRRGGALGLGDVKLAFGIGAALGAPAALTMVVYTALAGGALAIGFIAGGRSRRYAMPYGPSLALGALATLLFDLLVWH
jgi:leader peptidase (prepilin peptidase) / N-methyltransferase